MTIKVQHTGSREYGRYIKALICGPAGVGKTLISSTFPNPLYASAEGGLMSIADRKIPFVKIESSLDLLAVKHAIDQIPSVRESLLGFPVETIVIDTIDEVQRILIRERLEETKKDSMALPDWGWLGEQMQAIIRGFRNLDVNVVFTAHLKEVQDNDSGRVWLEPGLQGAISKQISAYVDLALLLRAVNRTKVVDNQAVQVMERHLITRPDSNHEWIKDRSGKLPPEIEVNFIDDAERLATMIFGEVELDDTEIAEIDEVAVETNGRSVVPEPADQPVSVSSPSAEPNKPAELTTIGSVEPERGAPPVTTMQAVRSPEAPVLPGTEPKLDVCEECGVEVDPDQRDLSRIRFRAVYCRPHFTEQKEKRARK